MLYQKGAFWSINIFSPFTAVQSKMKQLFSLSLVKDELCMLGDLKHFMITKGLLWSVKISYTCYKTYLDAQKTLKIKKKEMEQEKKQKEKADQVDRGKLQVESRYRLYKGLHQTVRRNYLT